MCKLGNLIPFTNNEVQYNIEKQSHIFKVQSNWLLLDIPLKLVYKDKLSRFIKILTVSPDMIFRRLFLTSNPKIYLETLTGI